MQVYKSSCLEKIRKTSRLVVVVRGSELQRGSCDLKKTWESKSNPGRVSITYREYEPTTNGLQKVLSMGHSNGTYTIHCAWALSTPETGMIPKVSSYELIYRARVLIWVTRFWGIQPRGPRNAFSTVFTVYHPMIRHYYKRESSACTLPKLLAACTHHMILRNFLNVYVPLMQLINYGRSFSSRKHRRR